MNLETSTIPCQTCGTLFESSSFAGEIAGKRIELRELHCEPCRLRLERGSSDQKPERKGWEAICDAAYLGFDRSMLPESSRIASDSVLRWSYSPRGYGLAGESRRGKTFILTELCRRQWESGKSVKMTLATDFAYACGSPDGGERREMIESCIAADILFLDDIAKPKMTDRVEADLFHVLERRKRNLRPVFATLNGNGNDLKAMLSEEGGNAIVNRLRHDVCEFIAI